MRTIIDLPEDQIRELADYCARENVSRAEAIRRAVSHYLASREAERREQAFREGFGVWKDKGIDTDTFLREIRAEWDR